MSYHTASVPYGGLELKELEVPHSIHMTHVVPLKGDSPKFVFRCVEDVLGYHDPPSDLPLV